MKKNLVVTAVISAVLLMGAQQAWSLSAETVLLLDLLKAKGVITQREATDFVNNIEALSEANAPVVDTHLHSVQSLSDREEKREAKSGESVANVESLADVVGNISFSGLLEADMISARTTDSDGAKHNSSDLILSTVQLSADAFYSHYVNGHLALLYEEDPDDSSNNNVTLDEAIVGLKGGEACPTYVNIGRMYLPFGHFESHFVSDPTTLTLGETNDTAVFGGYIDDIFNLGVGFFKGKVIEEGSNDDINSFVVSALFSFPKAIEDKLVVKSGVSYLSNLATSDSLESYADDTATPGEVANMVEGVSTFLSLSYDDTFFFDAEFLGAIDQFAVGDLSFVDEKNRKPQAWNVEAAVRVYEKMECALRYGGSNEAGTFLADDEYGAVFLYNIFDNTSFAVEYLFQEFQDNSKNNQATVHLAVEF